VQPLELLEQHRSPGPPRASAGRLRCACPETDGGSSFMAATPGEAPRSLLPSKSRGAEPLRSCHLTDIGEVRRLAEEAGEVDRIINFASWYGMIGNAGTVGYNITKEAVRGLTRTAAREWGRYALTVNVVAPTAKTGAADNIERADPEAMAAAVAAVPAGASATRTWISHRPRCSSPPTTPATSPARPSAWTEGCFCMPDEASAESNARIPSTTENSETKED